MIDVKFLLTVPVQTDHENEVTEICLDIIITSKEDNVVDFAV